MTRKTPVGISKSSLEDAMLDLFLESSENELIAAFGQAEFQAAAMRGQVAIEKALGATADTGRHARHQGLAAVLDLLKRREGLSDEELATKADIERDVLAKIATDPAYEASPRTIYQLERFYGLPKRSIGILAGAVRVEDPDALDSRALEFAAKSASIGKLSREERRLLNEFVKALHDMAEDA